MGAANGVRTATRPPWPEDTRCARRAQPEGPGRESKAGRPASIYNERRCQAVASEGPSAIECRQIADLLGDYLDGSLPARHRELIDFHIDGCAPCVAFVNTYRGAMDATRRLGDVPIPSELKKRLLAVLKSTAPPQSARSRSPPALRQLARRDRVLEGRPDRGCPCARRRLGLRVHEEGHRPCPSSSAA